jgi:hypothetical protein
LYIFEAFGGFTLAGRRTTVFFAGETGVAEVGDDSTGTRQSAPETDWVSDISPEDGARAAGRVVIWTGVISRKESNWVGTRLATVEYLMDSFEEFLDRQRRRVHRRLQVVQDRLNLAAEKRVVYDVEVRKAEGAHSCVGRPRKEEHRMCPAPRCL